MSAARLVILSYAGLCCLLYGCQGRMIYFPTKTLSGSPKGYGLAYEDVVLHPADGASVHGWWVPAEGARGTVLFCHGNAGNIADRLDSIRSFHGLGMNVFIFDYRGYGKSSGRPGEKRTYEDAMAAWKYLTEERAIQPGGIVIFGRSLGGAVAAWLAAEVTPAAAILESAFTSIVDVGKHYYPFLPVRLLTRIRYPVVEYVARIQCPLLVAHSPEDEVIPYEMGRRLFEAAGEPKEFLQMRGGHNDGFITTGAAYRDRLDEFLSKHLAAQAEP
jgi:fermentation-respiration switch protein FrsA (DUF1100 family)